jgi:hypothetical protein
MSAHTITTTYRNRRRRHLTALALTVGALAIPAGATAQPIDTGYSSANAASGTADGSDYSTVNSIVPPEPGTGSAKDVESGYSSLNSIAHEPADAPAAVSAPTGANDGFDWVSALVGAGTALAMAAFGGAALLTLRRRTAVSPSH